MADGFIVRKGGVTTEQALAPTITEVSTTQTSITFTITNNDASTAVILYELDDTTPDANSIELAAAATSESITLSGLSLGLNTLYATANVTNKVKSNVTEKEFILVNPFIVATGGTTLEYNSGGKRFKSHTFLSNGNFVVSNVGTTSDNRNKVDYLIVAGGGSGNSANASGSGGGAGGYRTTNGTSGGVSSAESKVVVTASTFNIIVGAGGALNTGFFPGINGSNSSIAFNTPVIATGGGTGIEDGGSGGGSFEAQSIGNGISGQGTNGGVGLAQGSSSGGGGGASEVGQNSNQLTGTSAIAGRGGNGLANLLRTGSNETRAGGGGGGAFFAGAIPGAGGTGGGGSGGVGTTNAVNATANTGGGGGGRGSNNSNNSLGGSGIVVIRYEIPTV